MKIFTHIRQHKYASVTLLLIANTVLFVLTNPSAGLASLLLGYLLAGLDIYVILRVVAKLLKLSGVFVLQQGWLMQATALFIFLLLIMQSLGQLSLKDVLVLCLFAVVGYGYFFLLQRHYQ